VTTLLCPPSLVSLTCLQTSGTAEQNTSFTIPCVANAVTAGHEVRAFLVLDGDCWKLRDYLTSGMVEREAIS